MVAMAGEDGESGRNDVAKTVKSVISGRNDFAKAVKRICEKRDQGFANLSQAWREEAECEVITEEGQFRSED